jgi:hypothetical protein
MVPVVVVVELAPADAPPTLADALLDSCSVALRRGTCARADTPEASPAQATAVIVWNGLDVRIEVGVQREGRPLWVLRELSFSSSDPEVERWRAAGLTVASLVGEVQPWVSTPQPEPPPPAAPVQRKDELTLRSDANLGVSALVGPGLSSGGVRVGGKLDAAHRVWGPAFVMGAVDHSVGLGTSEDLSLAWTSVAASGVYMTDVASGLELGASGGLVVQRTAASTKSEPTDSGSQWDPGLALGVLAKWPANESLSLRAGVDARQFWRGAEIRVGGEEAGKSSRWTAFVWLGLQWSLIPRTR